MIQKRDSIEVKSVIFKKKEPTSFGSVFEEEGGSNSKEDDTAEVDQRNPHHKLKSMIPHTIHGHEYTSRKRGGMSGERANIQRKIKTSITTTTVQI